MRGEISHFFVQSGTRLQFDRMGKMISQTSVAREVGTTITLHEIFKSLPVRYMQFEKNIKKEYPCVPLLLPPFTSFLYYMYLL